MTAFASKLAALAATCVVGSALVLGAVGPATAMAERAPIVRAQA